MLGIDFGDYATTNVYINQIPVMCNFTIFNSSTCDHLKIIDFSLNCVSYFG